MSATAQPSPDPSPDTDPNTRPDLGSAINRGISIRRLVDLEAEGVDGGTVLAGIDVIFRATAARWPDDPEASRVFHHLWLGQYIDHERDLVYVAWDAPRAVVAGYVVGTTIDPARSPRFAALEYFQVFAPHCARYPAHLHINCAEHYRNQGLGARLVAAFCERLIGDGVAGVHVVTARNQRNVGFYRRLGFVELAASPRGTTEVLFLGRKLNRH